MHRHFLITSALLLGIHRPAAAPRTSRSSLPRRWSRARAPSRSAPPNRRSGIESAPPQIQVETPGEPQIRIVQVPTIDGRMPEAVVGQTVNNSEGKDIGEVRDFVTQPDSAAIHSLVLSRSRLLGFGEKLVTIPWDKVRVDPQSHGMVATLSRGRTGNAPKFEYSGEARTVIGPEQPEK